MTTLFCEVWKRNWNDELLKAFEYAFRNKSDEQVKLGGYKCLEDLTYFPKPVEVIQRMPRETDNPNEDFIIWDDVKCVGCGHIGRGIKEPKEDGNWQCRVCYTGLSHAQVVEKFHQLYEIMDLEGL